MDLHALQQGYAAKTCSSVPAKTTREKPKTDNIKKEKSLWNTLSLFVQNLSRAKAIKNWNLQGMYEDGLGIYRKQVLMVTVHLWDTHQRRTKLTTGNARQISGKLWPKCKHVTLGSGPFRWHHLHQIWINYRI